MVGQVRLGLHLPPTGSAGNAHAAVFAANATGVDVCLLDEGGRNVVASHPLAHQLNGVWHGEVAGVSEDSLYALRVHGPWDPSNGLRHNPDKLMLDPYARLVSGRVHWGQSAFAHRVDDEWRPLDGPAGTGVASRRDATPNVGRIPVGVVTRESRADPSRRPRVTPRDTVVYEAHLRGLTMLHPQVPPSMRGTWAGLGHPAVVEHLVNLGITAVELLPVFAIVDEAHLVRRGKTNYWGYNTLNYFSPELKYVSLTAQSAGPAAVIAEVRDAVDSLHEAGLEVWLDVVYNHTCEGSVSGPSLSFRGIDSRSYYRLDHSGHDIDVTGCGNTLDFAHPRVVQLALDSLRYWTTTFGIDGYRFDLAPAMARRGPAVGEAYDPDHPFLVAARTDPILEDVKLVAEPWDLGTHGWRTGQFPPPFSEWNDHYRDGVRTFWLSDAAAERDGGVVTDVRDLATRLAGSSDMFHRAASYDAVHRDTHASINFITAHDGFTLTDLVSYNQRHNQANGENNGDGNGYERSWNHGAEGPTDDPAITASRRASSRALLGTLLLSIGTPMLLAGDEMGRTQGGNNNPYSLDDPSIWIDWSSADHDLEGHVRHLLALRARHPALRQCEWFFHRPTHPDGTTDLEWFGPSGRAMDEASWHNAGIRTLQMFLRGKAAHDASLLVVLNGSLAPFFVTLPGRPWAVSYRLLWDSSQDRPPTTGHVPEPVPAATEFEFPARCVRVYEAVT